MFYKKKLVEFCGDEVISQAEFQGPKQGFELSKFTCETTLDTLP